MNNPRSANAEDSHEDRIVAELGAVFSVPFKFVQGICREQLKRLAARARVHRFSDVLAIRRTRCILSGDFKKTDGAFGGAVVGRNL
jgi:hypothetical protein